MKKTKSTILAAAVSGLFLGAVTTSCGSSDAKSSSAPAAMEKHACKGMNTCAGKGGCKANGTCAGKNSCSGKGGCATVQHSCAGKNECKGQGGCKGMAGKNSCKGQGGCAVPVK